MAGIYVEAGSSQATLQTCKAPHPGDWVVSTICKFLEGHLEIPDAICMCCCYPYSCLYMGQTQVSGLLLQS